LGEQDGVARSLGNLGVVMMSQGDLTGAQIVCEESLAFFRERGDAENEARTLSNLGDIAYAQGANAEARARLEESLTIFRRIGARNGTLVGTLSVLGMVAMRQGDTAEAGRMIAEALRLAVEIGDGWSGVRALESSAKLWLAEGQPARAACLLGAISQTRTVLGIPSHAASQEALESDLSDVKAALSEMVYRDAWAEGAGLTWEQAVARALEDS
jgi:tetratricopeptide (TPR) repeat protein